MTQTSYDETLIAASILTEARETKQLLALEVNHDNAYGRRTCDIYAHHNTREYGITDTAQTANKLPVDNNAEH